MVEEKEDYSTEEFKQKHGGVVTVHEGLTIYKDGTVTSPKHGKGKMVLEGVKWDKGGIRNPRKEEHYSSKSYDEIVSQKPEIGEWVTPEDTIHITYRKR